MRNDEIKNKLVQWSNLITSRYPGLVIRFEYSESREVFLVSLYPNDIDEDDKENLSIDVMSFEDELSDLYGWDAPLFCDNEELFSLSQEAQTIVSFTETVSERVWDIAFDDLFVESYSYNLAA